MSKKRIILKKQKDGHSVFSVDAGDLPYIQIKKYLDNIKSLTDVEKDDE